MAGNFLSVGSNSKKVPLPVHTPSTSRAGDKLPGVGVGVEVEVEVEVDVGVGVCVGLDVVGGVSDGAGVVLAVLVGVTTGV